jgi:hypothetical protein
MKHAKSLLLFLLSNLIVFSSCSKTNDVSHIVAHHDSVSNTDWNIDTAKMAIIATAQPGDNGPMVQQMISYALSHPGYVITPEVGLYTCLNGIHIDSISSNVYKQVTVQIIGPNDATAPSADIANFYFPNPNGFGFGFQYAKSCLLKNVGITGPFTFMNGLSMLQIDTMAYSTITDGICRTNPVSPNAGIVIDPFSDPSHYDGVINQMYPNMSQYYIPGMSTSGSTNIQVVNCLIRNWVVGYMLSPAWQANGDLMRVDNTEIDNDRSSAASASGQNKQCVFTNLKEWGQTYDVFDNGHYGYGHTDGTNPPQIIGASIAGITNQIFDLQDPAYPLYASGIIAEGVFRIGRIFSYGGNLISGSTINLQQSLPGSPQADMVFWGPYTDWEGCAIRVYNASLTYGRIIMNSQANTFNGGSFGIIPVCVNAETILGYTPISVPMFSGVFSMYSNLYLTGPGSWDSTITLGTNIPITINPSAMTGSFIISASAGASVKLGDAITTHHLCYNNQLTGYMSYEYPVGWPTSISYGSIQDTVYVSHTGMGLYTGAVLNIYDQKLKAGY